MGRLVSCWKLLGVRSFVLEVGSWSGHDVPVNVHQTNVSLCSDKKGQGPKAHLLPSEVQALLRGGVPARAGHPARVLPPVPSLAEEADLSWRRPQGQVPRPRPAVIAEGARRPGPSQPSGSSGRPTGGQVPRTATQGDRHCH